MTTSLSAETRRYRGRALVLVGIALPFLGILGYVIQLGLQRLTIPWYMPAAGTLGVACVVLSFAFGRSVWRWLALLLALLLCAGQWGILVLMRLPPYTGPVAVGKAFPAFTTQRSDGTAFTQHDLEGDRDNVLVFFRGRW